MKLSCDVDVLSAGRGGNGGGPLLNHVGNALLYLCVRLHHSHDGVLLGNGHLHAYGNRKIIHETQGTMVRLTDH